MVQPVTFIIKCKKSQNHVLIYEYVFVYMQISNGKQETNRVRK